MSRNPRNQTRLSSRLATIVGIGALSCTMLFASGCQVAQVSPDSQSQAPAREVAAVSGVAYAAETDADATSVGTVVVNGSESVLAAPDTARVILRVRTQAADATEAQDDCARKTEAVKQALHDFGVADEDIKTDSVSLYPTYDYSGSYATIVGYEMSVSITVDKLGIDQIGDVIAVATAAGANTVNGVSFYVSDYDSYYVKALQQAIDLARVKALAIAEAAGYTLGDVSCITEGYSYSSYRTTSTNLEYAAADMAGGAPTPKAASLGVDPGEVEIEATVTVEYKLVR